VLFDSILDMFVCNCDLEIWYWIPKQWRGYQNIIDSSKSNLYIFLPWLLVKF